MRVILVVMSLLGMSFGGDPPVIQTHEHIIEFVPGPDSPDPSDPLYKRGPGFGRIPDFDGHHGHHGHRHHGHSDYGSAAYYNHESPGHATGYRAAAYGGAEALKEFVNGYGNGYFRKHNNNKHVLPALHSPLNYGHGPASLNSLIPGWMPLLPRVKSLLKAAGLGHAHYRGPAHGYGAPLSAGHKLPVLSDPVYGPPLLKSHLDTPIYGNPFGGSVKAPFSGPVYGDPFVPHAPATVYGEPVVPVSKVPSPVYGEPIGVHHAPVFGEPFEALHKAPVSPVYTEFHDYKAPIIQEYAPVEPIVKGPLFGEPFAPVSFEKPLPTAPLFKAPVLGYRSNHGHGPKFPGVPSGSDVSITPSVSYGYSYKLVPESLHMHPPRHGLTSSYAGTYGHGYHGKHQSDQAFHHDHY